MNWRSWFVEESVDDVDDEKIKEKHEGDQTDAKELIKELIKQKNVMERDIKNLQSAVEKILIKIGEWKSETIEKDKSLLEFCKPQTTESKVFILPPVPEQKVDEGYVIAKCGNCGNIYNQYESYWKYCSDCFKEKTKRLPCIDCNKIFIQTDDYKTRCYLCYKNYKELD